MTATPAEQQIRRQQWIVLGLTIVVAATRFLPLARSMWDWDEALFSLALHDYNVAAHHPHPPGFPLYIGLGRFLRAFVIHDDFRALRTIQLLASMCAFPVMYALGRAMRFTFSVAVSAALLFVFLPNVWAFGGTAFSDIFNIVLLMAGLALLFGSGRSAPAIDGPGTESRESGLRSYLVGTTLFALSLLVKPQNVLCAWPWFAASWPRVREKRCREVIGSMLVAIAIVATGYGIAAGATGWRDYIAAIRSHEHYLETVDSYRNPNRPPSLELLPEVVIDPYDAGKVSLVVFAFAVAGLYFAKRSEVEAVATFLPFLVFALFMLGPLYAGRYSIGFMPLLALLAASGIERVSARVGRLFRRPLVAVTIQAFCVVLIAGRFATWLAPALRVVRRTDSPPVSAMKWVRENVPPNSDLIIHGSLLPVAKYYLGGYNPRFVTSEDDVQKLGPVRNTWYIGNRLPTGPLAVTFARPRNKLFAIFSRRYFEVSVCPLTGAIRYADGWYDEETDGASAWRWMRGRGTLVLSPIPAGGELRFTAFFPIDHEPPPEVVVRIDGEDTDRFVASTAVVTRVCAIAPSPNPHTVEITISHVVNPAGQHFGADTRDLGMQVRSLIWQR